ncbi:MAG: FMN-binding protein [Spirochaetaceae bacterium]|jgi:uncharacterized protein with FMN-binding domain|nr:FMN-binding protein [Spirochaetaceae bacterium]
MQKNILYPALIALSLFGCGGSGETEPENRYKPGVYADSAEGYHATHTSGTPVTVQAVFSETAILSVAVTNHSETSTRPAIQTALAQLPQSVVNAQSAQIDGVSGATFTSAAILEAVRACIAQAQREGGGYEPGTYTASAKGYHSAQNSGAPVRVRLEFSATAITEFKVISHSETYTREAVKTALSQIPQAVLKRQSAEVDGVTGATFTSEALITAAQACIDQAALP